MWFLPDFMNTHAVCPWRKTLVTPLCTMYTHWCMHRHRTVLHVCVIYNCPPRQRRCDRRLDVKLLSRLVVHNGYNCQTLRTSLCPCVCMCVAPRLHPLLTDLQRGHHDDAGQRRCPVVIDSFVVVTRPVFVRRFGSARLQHYSISENCRLATPQAARAAFYRCRPWAQYTTRLYYCNCRSIIFIGFNAVLTKQR